MRLTERQIRIIKEEVECVFGHGVPVWLFGSRMDDHARGGDIDLMIEAALEPDEALDKEMQLHARLTRRLGEQRIDLVIHRTASPLQSIHQQALDTGQRL